MRPAGEVRVALLSACMTVGRPTTLREMAQAACVGYDAARSAVRDMRRGGLIRQVGERRVSYRNRPVAEYVPAAVGTDNGYVDLASVCKMWVG